MDESQHPKKYQKARILLATFWNKYDPANPQKKIVITIGEIINTADTLGIPRPGNIHNFFKDFTRGGKMSPSLKEISDLGFFLQQIDQAGELIKDITDKEKDPFIFPTDLQFQVINSDCIPREVFDLVRTDEGGILSVIEYCSILNIISGSTVFRVQSPVKVAPNEIDGLYVFIKDNKRVLYSIEAKSKGNDVILKHQMYGAAGKAYEIFGNLVDRIVPMGAKIEKDNSICIAIFNDYTNDNPTPDLINLYKFKIEPVPYQWIKRTKLKAMKG